MKVKSAKTLLVATDGALTSMEHLQRIDVYFSVSTLSVSTSNSSMLRKMMPDGVVRTSDLFGYSLISPTGILSFDLESSGVNLCHGAIL